MVCPVNRLGVLVVGESIAQAAVPGTRPVPVLCASQNDSGISLKNLSNSLIAAQNNRCYDAAP
jgi:hypothetical protein